MRALLVALSIFAIALSAGCRDDSPSSKGERFDLSPSLPESGRLEVRSAREMTLEVEVRPYPKKRYAYNRNLVLVRFVNTTNRPIKILRPLDGSLWCYYVPYYKFDVRDAKGAGMKLPIPDDVWGLWAGMRWPEDYVVEIRPGESFEKEIGIEHLIRRDGKYKVTFSYVYLSDKTNPLSLKYPYGLWEGTATSRTAEIELRKN